MRLSDIKLTGEQEVHRYTLSDAIKELDESDLDNKELILELIHDLDYSADHMDGMVSDQREEILELKAEIYDMKKFDKLRKMPWE